MIGPGGRGRGRGGCSTACLSGALPLDHRAPAAPLAGERQALVSKLRSAMGGARRARSAPHAGGWPVRPAPTRAGGRSARLHAIAERLHHPTRSGARGRPAGDVLAGLELQRTGSQPSAVEQGGSVVRKLSRKTCCSRVRFKRSPCCLAGKGHEVRELGAAVRARTAILCDAIEI